MQRSHRKYREARVDGDGHPTSGCVQGFCIRLQADLQKWSDDDLYVIAGHDLEAATTRSGWCRTFLTATPGQAADPAGPVPRGMAAMRRSPDPAREIAELRCRANARVQLHRRSRRDPLLEPVSGMSDDNPSFERPVHDPEVPSIVADQGNVRGSESGLKTFCQRGGQLVTIPSTGMAASRC